MRVGLKASIRYQIDFDRAGAYLIRLHFADIFSVDVSLRRHASVFRTQPLIPIPICHSPPPPSMSRALAALGCNSWRLFYCM